MNNPKIVFCHLLNDNSGSPRVLVSTIKALGGIEAGNLLYLGSQGRGILETTGIAPQRYWYRRSNYRIVTLVTYLLSQLHLYRALSRAHNIPADAVIYVNTLLPIGAALWGKRHRRRVVIHVHEASITPTPLRWLLTLCARISASQLIYVSTDHLQRLPLPGPLTTVIPNPINSEILTQANTQPAHVSRTFNVLMLASLRTYKGINEFMLLAKELAVRDDIRFTLLLNEDRSKVMDFAEAHPESANVSLHPRTDHPGPFYQKANLVLNLSRVDQCIETFGLTIVEAMSFGVPVIVPPIGGPAEIVTDGREGFCIDSRNINALREAVITLADNPAQMSAMSMAAKKRSQDFSFEQYAKRLNSIFSTLDHKDRI